MTNHLLMRVARSFALPGLGVLLLPETMAPALLSFDLHTALALTLHLPDGAEATTIATVEEISQPDAPETRALLLTQEGAAPVPAGTEVWWAGTEISWDQLV